MNKIMKLFSNSINLDVIKILALITMLIDHIGHILFPNIYWLRIIGRSTFPIFAFLISYHLATKNVFIKYIKRLLPFAILTTLFIAPFEVIIKDYFRFNILWSFLVAILALFVFEKVIKEKIHSYLKIFIISLSFILCGSLSYLCDYKLTGFLLLVFFYFYFKTNKKVFLFATLADAALLNSEYLFTYPKIVVPYVIVTFLTVLISIITAKYAPKKQKRFLKHWWIFYAIYPAHLLIIYLIKIIWF